ncbi:MAG: DoxX family protein [Alphaproteobacteria bacterium]
MATTTEAGRARGRHDGGLAALYRRVDDLVGAIAEPVILLGLRVYVFYIFFRSGLAKIDNFGGTVDLFANDEWGYGPVSFLPPEIMAFLATAFELICPVLILIGLLTRLASVPLLAMTILIQFVLAAAIRDYHNIEHFVFMAALAILLRFGPGLVSIDHWLRRRA